jgi:RimJ/RimL family protein N-acetyltransferase
MRGPESRILRNGTTVRLRPIQPDDAPRLLALCERLSSRTIYQRFFTIRKLRPEEADALANVEGRTRMGIVADVDDGDERSLIGVARYAPSADGTIDVGFVVADAWQGQGVGTLLLVALLRAGEERGIHEFTADVLGDNRQALRLIGRHTTITARTLEQGVFHLVFEPRSSVEPAAVRAS